VLDLYLTDLRAVLIVDDKDIEAILTMLHYIRGDNQDVGSAAGLLPGVDEIALIDEAKPARPEIGDRHASAAMLPRTFGTGDSSSGRPLAFSANRSTNLVGMLPIGRDCADSGRLSYAHRPNGARLG
jgi:hypothetical protein